MTKVLVIDDSELALAQIEKLLRVGGYEVLTLPSAIGASRVIQREQVGAIVVDITLPGLSGDRLVETLRRNARTKHLVIVVVSACESDELEVIRERCGADEAVAKRELSAALLGAVSRALCRASTARLVR